MIKRTRTVLLFILFLVFFIQASSLAQAKLVGKKNQVSFDKALPEDISNDNFPDTVESFDYPNADILDLVKAIGKLTGLNFIVEPSLSGKKISVIAPSKITVAEAYKAFLSALSIHGYTLVKSGAFWKIQTAEKAHKDNIEVYSGEYYPNTDQLITRIIKLKHINAEEFQKSIKFILSQNAASHYSGSNSVIISDYGSVIERVMKIAHALDVPGSKESVRIITIEHASATRLADIINDLLSSNQALSSRSRRGRKSIFRSGADTSGSVKISQVLADERTNSIVISANLQGFQKIKGLIKKLDTYIDPTRTGGIYVYNVLYGTAEDVYNTLTGIKPSSSIPRFNRSSRTRSQPRRIQSSNTGSGTSPLFGDNVTIMADMNTNSLIISAKNKYDFERVKQVLKKIDVPRDQVFVQAVIVEMSVDKDDDWEVNLAHSIGAGIQKLLGDKIDLSKVPLKDDIIGGFLNSSFSANPDSILKNSQLGPGLVFGLPLQKILKGIGLNTDDNSGGSENRQTLAHQALNLSVFPLLQILKQAGNVNVLSTPQITALDNITASIEVGENAPVGVKSTATGFSSFAQNSVEREDVTLKLEITPRINPDSGTVQMKIHQKFDDFSTRVSQASDLKDKGVHIIKRNIETQMVLNDGETAVLGGLLVDKEVQSESKIPLLGDLPILGWLFKGSNTRKEKRNLVVFITPRIIKGESQKEQMKQLLGEKIQERETFIKKHMRGRDPYKKLIGSTKDNNSFQTFSEEADILPEDYAPAVQGKKPLSKKRKSKKESSSSNFDTEAKDVKSFKEEKLLEKALLEEELNQKKLKPSQKSNLKHIREEEFEFEDLKDIDPLEAPNFEDSQIILEDN